MPLGGRAGARLAAAPAVRRAVPVPCAARRPPRGTAPLRRPAAPERRADGRALADGCLDRRLDVLETHDRAARERPEAIAGLTSDEVKELRRLAPALEEACRRLAAAGLPSTLVHGDLHMFNVARLNGALVYFDWSDACIAHPFIDLLSLLSEDDESHRAACWTLTWSPGGGAVTAERLQEAVALAAVVIPLHHAVSYQHIVAGLEPTPSGSWMPRRVLAARASAAPSCCRCGMSPAAAPPPPPGIAPYAFPY